MRARSNRSVVIVIFICLLVAAVIAYRTKQVGVRDFPRSAGRGPQAESTDARIGPKDIYPDPIQTPGAVNLDITQDDIDQTICNPQWSTRSVRPPAHYTDRLKFEQIEEYGDSDRDPRDYEEDHLIPLRGGLCNMGSNHPSVALGIDNGSAAVAPKHIHHRSLGHGPELYRLCNHLVCVLRQQIQTRR